ncbi:MAG: plasmid stabilization protein [Kangiella sp.]|nr:MAG: plasmid stabilization protein [Kangiella sp.]PHS19866.1 MAG: plasmid stabilization protein [Kangiella sp.]
MSFYFHPAAEMEFNDAISYYEGIESRLGFDFSLEVHSAIKRAELMPKAWALIDGSVRRSLTARFPYGVLYSQYETGIYILAVMNLHRQPDYWKYRN